MAAGKWIGGFLGWIAGGPLGALAGLAIGAMFDYGMDSVNTKSNSGTFGSEDIYGSDRQRSYEAQRNGFLFSLLVLAAYVIRADGRVMHSEMEVVRKFLRSNFGEQSVRQGEDILHRLFDEQKRQGEVAYRNTVAGCCEQMVDNMSYSERLQLLDFLAVIAKVDGRVVEEEIAVIKNISHWLGMSSKDVDSMLNLSGNSLEEAYKVLGVPPTATDDEVRRAYRRLALEHHPDRVAALGEDIRKAAERKFQEINEARERVFKSRGM